MLGHYELRELQSARVRAHNAEAQLARARSALAQALAERDSARAAIQALDDRLALTARSITARELAAEGRGRDSALAHAQAEAVRAARDIAQRDSELRQLRAQLRALSGALRRALPDGMLTGEDCRDALDAAAAAGADAR